MRKSDLINNISDKTGIPKVDVLVTIETMLKEIKENILMNFLKYTKYNLHIYFKTELLN